MKDKYYIENDDKRIYFTLLKTKRKTIGIIIDRNGEVRVHAPYRVSEKQICEAVKKRANWIIKKVNEVKARNSNLTCRQFVSGEKLLYHGKEYTLVIMERDFGKPEVLIKEDFMEVYIPRGLPAEIGKQVIKETLIKWYRQRFAETAKEKLEKYSKQLRTAPCKTMIKSQKTRWGSCSKKGNINLNWRLIMAPDNIIDYVIVHELCHLKVMNHSKDFWNLVKSVLPDYPERRKWLKENGYRLAI